MDLCRTTGGRLHQSILTMLVCSVAGCRVCAWYNTIVDVRAVQIFQNFLKINTALPNPQYYEACQFLKGISDMYGFSYSQLEVCNIMRTDASCYWHFSCVVWTRVSYCNHESYGEKSKLTSYSVVFSHGRCACWWGMHAYVTVVAVLLLTLIQEWVDLSAIWRCNGWQWQCIFIIHSGGRPIGDSVSVRCSCCK